MSSINSFPSYQIPMFSVQRSANGLAPRRGGTFGGGMFPTPPLRYGSAPMMTSPAITSSAPTMSATAPYSAPSPGPAPLPVGSSRYALDDAKNNIRTADTEHDAAAWRMSHPAPQPGQIDVTGFPQINPIQWGMSHPAPFPVEVDHANYSEASRFNADAHARIAATPPLPREMFDQQGDIARAYAQAPVAVAEARGNAAANVADINQQGRVDAAGVAGQSRVDAAGTAGQSRENVAGINADSKETVAAGQNASRENVGKMNAQSRQMVAEIAAAAKGVQGVAQSGAKAPTPANITAAMGHFKGVSVPNEKFDANKPLGPGNYPTRSMSLDELKKTTYDFFGLKSPDANAVQQQAQPQQVQPQAATTAPQYKEGDRLFSPSQNRYYTVKNGQPTPE